MAANGAQRAKNSDCTTNHDVTHFRFLRAGSPADIVIAVRRVTRRFAVCVHSVIAARALPVAAHTRMAAMTSDFGS
jgi:hypothetical protein